MNAAETKTDNDNSFIFYKSLFENHSAISNTLSRIYFFLILPYLFFTVLKSAMPLKRQEPLLLHRIQMSAFYTKHLSLLQARQSVHLIELKRCQSVHLIELQDYQSVHLIYFQDYQSVHLIELQRCQSVHLIELQDYQSERQI